MSMFCQQCGHGLSDDANFCPSCGSRVPRDLGETTTVSLDVGALDPSVGLEDLPELAPGTGMVLVVRGPNAGSRYLLDRDLTSIGRHPDSHIFLDDVTVSRRHAEIRRDGEELVLHDLGSLNGTYVNGDRADVQPLRTGDEVQVGRFRLVFVGAPRA